jgi:hypothetical protein
MRPVGSAGGAVFDCFGGDKVQMSTARMATSPTMMTNMPAAAKQQQKHNNQPKTPRLDEGETRYDAQVVGDAMGAQVDRFRAIELG